MKFYIESTNWGGKEKDLIEHYPWLKDFGYEDEHITVKSLKALMDLVNKTRVTDGIILLSDHNIYDPKSKKWIRTGVPAIEIYDGYKE